jgi:hypothetical protein
MEIPRELDGVNNVSVNLRSCTGYGAIRGNESLQGLLLSVSEGRS